MNHFTIRSATPADAADMATVHTTCWQQAYRGLVDDHVLDSPAAVPRRQRMWATALTRDPDGTSAAVVAEADGMIIGLASAGTPRDDDATWPIELYVLYLLASHHGSGAGAALLHAVIADQRAALWVADPNPRAQAFYRKSGFTPDGASKDDGIPEIRMVRNEPSPERR